MHFQRNGDAGRNKIKNNNIGGNKQLEDGREGRRQLVKKMKGNMRNMGGELQEGRTG